VGIEIEMLEKIRAAYVAHAAECEHVPKAILFHAGNHNLIGWDEILGLPALPDERVAPMRFRLLCGTGHGGYCMQGKVYWDEDGSPYVIDIQPKAA
jgi:hypothetical protein